MFLELFHYEDYFINILPKFLQLLWDKQIIAFWPIYA